MMFSRKIRIAILVALAGCAATPTILEAQAKKRTTTTRRRARRPSRNRPPPVPVVRCPIHGIAYDTELEICPDCAKTQPAAGPETHHLGINTTGGAR